MKLIFEVTESGEQAWVDEIMRVYRNQEAFQAACTPGYYNNEGKPSPLAAQNSAYGKGPIAYFKKLQTWREEGNMKGLEFR